MHVVQFVNNSEMSSRRPQHPQVTPGQAPRLGQYVNTEEA